MKAITVAFLFLVLFYLGWIIKCEIEIIRDQIKIYLRRQRGESCLDQCHEEDAKWHKDIPKERRPMSFIKTE